MPPGFSSADFFYLLPEIIVTIGSAIVLGLDLIVRRAPQTSDDGSGTDRLLAWTTIATIVAAGAALMTSAGVHTTIARGLLAIDGFAFFFKVLFLLSAGLTVLMSERYIAIERAHAGEYYFLILCATLGMMVIASGLDLITIFIGLETMAVSFYILAGFIRPSRRSNEAAVKYFVLGAFSLAILLYGMSLLYGLSGTTHLGRSRPRLATGESGPMLRLAVLLLVAGIGFKIAAVPFHMWAPDVYEGAPTPITAFLSVGSKAASFAMLLRIFIEGLPVQNRRPRRSSWSAGVVLRAGRRVDDGGQRGGVDAIEYQADARLLVGRPRRVRADRHRGRPAARHHGGARLPDGLRLHAARRVRGHHRAQAARGDRRRAQGSGGAVATPSGAAVAMLVFMLSLGGIPPTAGFMGKLWLFGAAIDAGYVWLAVIGVLNSALSLYYYVRIVVSMWITPGEAAETARFSPAVTAVLVVAVAGTIVLGVYPRWLFDFASSSAASLGAAPLLGLK